MTLKATIGRLLEANERSMREGAQLGVNNQRLVEINSSLVQQNYELQQQLLMKTQTVFSAVQQQQQLQGVQAALFATQQQLQGAQVEVSTVKQHLDGAKGALIAKQMQLLDVQAEASTTQKQLQDAQGELSLTQEELQDAEAEVCAKQTQLKDVQRAFSATRQELKGVQGALSATQKQLRNAHAEISATRQALQDAHADVSAKRRKLMGARAENSSLKERLSTSETLLENMRTDKEEATVQINSQTKRIEELEEKQQGRDATLAKIVSKAKKSFTRQTATMESHLDGIESQISELESDIGFDAFERQRLHRQNIRRVRSRLLLKERRSTEETPRIPNELEPVVTRDQQSPSLFI